MQLLMIYYVGIVVLAALLEPLNELCEKKLETIVPRPLKDAKQKPFLTWERTLDLIAKKVFLE